MGGESLYAVGHTHASPSPHFFAMKLVYTLASLATALVTGAELELSTKNVRQLQSSLESKIADKYNAKLRQSRQKRGIFNNYLNNEINLNEYQQASAECAGLTSDFWLQCRQCVAQQCTTYMSQNCGSNSPVPAEMSSSEFAEFLAQRMGPVSPSITEIDDYMKILSKNGVNAEIDYQMNGVNLQLNTADLASKKKIAKRDTDVAIDCMNIVSEVNNIKVECARSNDGPVPAELQAEEMKHTIDNTQFGNWILNVQGTHPTDMNEQGVTADGKIQIRLTVLPNSDEDDFGDYFRDTQGNAYGRLEQKFEYSEFAPLTADESSYPAHEGNSQGCDGPGCMNLGGNEYIVNEEDEFSHTSLQFDCDGNADSNCNQMILNYDHELSNDASSYDAEKKPCDDENQPAEPIPADYEDILQLQADQSAFCDGIGGCPDVPIVRRNSRGNRVVRAAKGGARCADVATMPATCLAYGFECDACEQNIRSLCPDYHALRSELSAKIAEASSLAEEFQTISRRDFEQIKFLHALNLAGAKAIYVQSATKQGDNVSLEIRVGSASQAATVLVDAKIKSADDWSEVNSKIADKVVELF